MPQSNAMTADERRAMLSLALIYMVRMLGLFIILPVFSLFAGDYHGSTPFLIGLAIGIYGLFQAGLQIPFGMLSDRIGRKPVITGGLLLLCLGSVIAAVSSSIEGVIVGRALQGAGAISAVLMALAADLTRPSQRTKIMASLGASIGLSFMLALILGPVLIGWYSIDVLFWFTAVSALLAIVVLHGWVPHPMSAGFSADTGARLQTVRQLLRDPQLLRLDFSIFVLHLLITASFVAVPLSLQSAGLERGEHWQVYLAAVVLSLIMAVPLIVLAEKRYMRIMLLVCVSGLMLTQLVFALVPDTVAWLFVGILLFFGFLTALEALLPSLLSRLAPAGCRGSASGIYSTSQFFGAFLGGAGGGWLLGELGSTGLFVALAALVLVWCVVMLGFRSPGSLSSHRYPLSEAERARGDRLAAELEALPGVEEVIVSLDEGIAYMKVDKRVFRPLDQAAAH